MLEGRDLKALETFELKYTNDYQTVIAKSMQRAYEYAKKGTADELKTPSPATKRETTLFIKQQAQAIASKQLSDLLFKVKAEVLGQLRKNTLSDTSLGLSDVLGAVTAAFSAFFDREVSLTGAISIAMAVNRGRDDVFESNRNQIEAYQFSAILDDAICPICQDLDGSVIDYAEYRSTQWMPPIHHNCRCIWVAILKEQSVFPSLTGLPNQPGGVATPAL